MPVPTDPDEQPTGTAVFLPGPAHPPNRHRDRQRDRWARWVSLGGSMATCLSLPVVAYQLTASSRWTALVLVAGCLPHLAGTPATGVVARWPDRQRLRTTVDWANAALLASVPVAFAVDALTAPQVLVVAFGAQALFVFFDAAGCGTAAAGYGAAAAGCGAAAAGSGTPRGPRRLGRPLFVGSTAAPLTIPVLAAALLLLTAVPPLLTVDGVSLIAAAVAVRAIAPAPGAAAVVAPRVPRPGLGVGLRRRLSDLRSRPTDQVLVLVCALHAAAGGAFLGLFTPWVDQDLGVRAIRDVRLGLLLGLWAAGAPLATAVLPRAATRLARGGVLAPAAADRLVTTGVLPRAVAARLVGAGDWSRSRFGGWTGGSGRPRARAYAGQVLGRAADRLGGYRVSLVFLPTSALCLLCCAVAPHWVVAAAALAAWGTAYTVVVLDAKVAEGGLKMLAFGLGWPAGAVVGGLVAGAAGPRAGLISGVLMVVAAAAVAWLVPLATADRTGPIADRA